LSISEKSSKIKFLEKFQKNLFNFLYKKWGREAPGTPQGDPPCHDTTWWRSPGLAAPWHGEGGPWPSTYLSTSTSLSLPKYLHTTAQTSVLVVLPRDFSISLLSPSLLLRFGAFVLQYVTSFDYPNRILFSGVFLEYFSSIGDRLNEFACLFYCLEMLF
jgi:hypothetical protein